MIETGLDTIALTVPARAAYVRIVRLVVAGVGNALSFDVEEIDDLKTAVGEAYNMFHPSERHPLTMRVVIDGHQVAVELAQGLVSDPSRFFVMDPAMERGIGLVLMKHLMDEVDYETDSSGTRIRLVKHRR